MVNIMKILCNERSYDKDWWKNYYDEVSVYDICRYCHCDKKDVRSAQVLPGYDVRHVSWLLAKPQYRKILDCFDIVELVDEAGDIFLSDISGGRLYNVEYEIRTFLGIQDP